MLTCALHSRATCSRQSRVVLEHNDLDELSCDRRKALLPCDVRRLWLKWLGAAALGLQNANCRSVDHDAGTEHIMRVRRCGTIVARLESDAERSATLVYNSEDITLFRPWAVGLLGKRHIWPILSTIVRVTAGKLERDSLPNTCVDYARRSNRDVRSDRSATVWQAILHLLSLRAEHINLQCST